MKFILLYRKRTDKQGMQSLSSCRRGRVCGSGQCSSFDLMGHVGIMRKVAPLLAVKAQPPSQSAADVVPSAAQADGCCFFHS